MLCATLRLHSCPAYMLSRFLGILSGLLRNLCAPLLLPTGLEGIPSLAEPFVLPVSAAAFKVQSV